eukprot:gene852-10600_t
MSGKRSSASVEKFCWYFSVLAFGTQQHCKRGLANLHKLRNGEQCVQPSSGLPNPPVRDLLLLTQCSHENKFKFNFYDDKDTLQVVIKSESCDDIPSGTSCSQCKGLVFVNGGQYSPNSPGINVVLFDYRSGLFEEKTSYRIYGHPDQRVQLTSFLNNLPDGKILFLSAKDSVYIDNDLAVALQKIGVSATFAIDSPPTSKMSLAFVGFTGQERKIWEKSINNLGGSGGSPLQVTINTFVDRDGVNDCSDELGIRVKRIPQARFFATSVLKSDVDFQPYAASLHHKTQWCSKTYSTVSKEYLQVDLGVVKLVSGIAMQGHSSSSDRVTEFQIQYSENGVSWQFYKDLQNLEQKFNGTRTTRQATVDTKVSWFLNTRARFVRIIGTARKSSYWKSCFRFELFGCSIARSFLSVEWTPDSSSYINDSYKGSISTFGTVQENVTVGISASGDNQSLATNIGQIHLLKLNASTIVDNGTLLEDTDDNTMVKDNIRQINSAAVVQFDIKEQNYHAFDIDFAGNILDDGLPTGYRYLTITSETGDAIAVHSAPFFVSRWQRDQSILQLNATHENEEWYTHNSLLTLNLTLSHLAAQSHANAYGVNIMIYYNSEFLQFKSIELMKTSAFTLPMSRNVTRPGLILIQNDAVWLQNDQFLSIKFQVSIPKGLSRGEDCNGNILIEFSYHNNLAKLSGTVNTTLERPVPFKCKVNQAKNIKVKSVRLPSPEFSMVYDDINQDFFFCLQKKIYMTRNAPTCFLQQKDKTSWGIIPFMSTVEAVDVEKRILYGLDRVGKSYAISVFPYAVMDQIEDSVWTAVIDQPQTRISVKANTLGLLPSSPENPMIISISGKASWAATKRGILKEANGIWQRVTNFVL